ncbi:MAG: sigma-54-dependent Fis family transcriptional regulator, partial [Verrucomicrobiales bacterium]|nr:sigma-54-dependent Fis family transcriptional regulator [Verrucomicrobiales bacterium]
VIAATNRDLAGMVEEGTFREDLYWRLRVVTLHMPPLRDRKSDIPVLADHFLQDLAEANGKPEKPLGDDVMPALMNYNWPGNVRELRTVIEHGVVMSNSSRIMLKHLPGYLSHAPGGMGLRAPSVPAGSGRAETRRRTEAAAAADVSGLDLESAEKQLIQEALGRTGNNRTEAADLLGISRRTLQRKLKEMGLVRSHTKRKSS